jgi:reverse transcriptase-like protein
MQSENVNHANVRSPKNWYHESPQREPINHGKKTHIDLIKANPGYNDSTQLLHFYCDATRSHRVIDLKYHKDDPLNNVREAIYQFLAWVHTQFGYNVINAFLNSELDEEIYVRMPDGFAETGMCWMLLKALYGLRQSPKL